MWGLALLVLTIVILVLLNFVGVIGSTMVEREVLKNSHQYKEARSSEVVMYEAQLTEINSQLSNTTDPATRNALKSQQAAINVRLRAAKAKQK